VATLKVLAEPPSAGAAAAAAGASGGDPSAQQRQQQELGFEMVCALVNNSVDCYNQSLEFTEHVQVRFAGCSNCNLVLFVCLRIGDTCRRSCLNLGGA
jgi:hypothetical protein